MVISQVCQPLNVHYVETQFENCITLKLTIAMGKIANNSSTSDLWRNHPASY
jgi:hypothetical protein